MNSSEECHNAWHDGYIAGWREIFPNSTPPVPPREEGVPAGVKNAPQHYFEKARILGRSDALRRASGQVV